MEEAVTVDMVLGLFYVLKYQLIVDLGTNYIERLQLRHVYFRMAKSRESAGGIMAQQTRTPITTTNPTPSPKPST